jgi:hypothetical protein
MRQRLTTNSALISLPFIVRTTLSTPFTTGLATVDKSRRSSNMTLIPSSVIAFMTAKRRRDGVSPGCNIKESDDDNDSLSLCISDAYLGNNRFLEWRSVTRLSGYNDLMSVANSTQDAT